jgi:hypothetical protein
MFYVLPVLLFRSYALLINLYINQIPIAWRDLSSLQYQYSDIEWRCHYYFIKILTRYFGIVDNS